MHLFTYGTLQFEEVWLRVAGVRLPKQPGTLSGFAAYRVQDAEYPGITAEVEAVTTGTIYYQLDQRILARLDAFEGEDYERQEVSVKCENGATLPCQTYVIPPTNRQLLTSEAWTADAFVASGGLQRFLNRYAGFSRNDGID
ncbi:MAG: gamma-glutamylcyclotransferase family protein [Planctomycetota bacterium]